MSDIPDLREVRVSCLIGRSDHFHVGTVLDWSLGGPDFEFSQKVVLKLLASCSFRCCTNALGCH